MKICITCKNEKSIKYFHKDKTKKDGYNPRCKDCMKIYYINNRYNIIKYNTSYNKSDAYRKYQREYHLHYDSNKRAIQLHATPFWSEIDEIKELYKQSAILNSISDEFYHVDHIVPLKSKVVCGLHCISNLRIILASENISKGNRHWPDM